jgi:cytidine deaminase
MMEHETLIEEAYKYFGEFPLGAPGLAAGSVAAALVTEAGNVYTGICLDLASGIGFCAEHAAVAAMLKQRETRISKIVAVGQGRILPPCGRCRELIAQINPHNMDCEVIIERDQSVKLRDLLPHWWLSE